MGLVDLLGVYPPLLGEYPPSLALADYWSHLVLGFTPLPGVCRRVDSEGSGWASGGRRRPVLVKNVIVVDFLRPVSGPGLRSSPVLRLSGPGAGEFLRPVSGPVSGRSPVLRARAGPETRFLRSRARVGPETRFLRHRARAGPETRFLRSRARVGPETRFLLST